MAVFLCSHVYNAYRKRKPKLILACRLNSAVRHFNKSAGFVGAYFTYGFLFKIRFIRYGVFIVHTGVHCVQFLCFRCHPGLRQSPLSNLNQSDAFNTNISTTIIDTILCQFKCICALPCCRVGFCL